MSALLLTLPLGKYFGFDEIWDDATAVEGLRQVGEAGQACYWIHHKVAAPLRIAAPEGCTTCRQACTRGLAEWDEECRAFECGTSYCAIFAHDVSDSRAVPLAELEGGAGGRPADLKCYRKATYEFHQLFQQYDADGREMTGCGWKEAWDTEERYYQRFDAGTCGTCESDCGRYDWCWVRRRRRPHLGLHREKRSMCPIRRAANLRPWYLDTRASAHLSSRR